MAMFEEWGTCPNDEMLHYGEANEVSPMWNRSSAILGDRIAYMVYKDNEEAFKGNCYITEAIVGSQSTLGIEIACALRHLIPTCVFGKSGRPICCHDLINPHKIPATIREINEEWFLGAEEDPAKTILLQDEQFLVAIQDSEQEVHIYLYKK